VLAIWPGTQISLAMYAALKCVASRLPNVGLSSLQCRVSNHLSAVVASHRMFAIRTDFTETVYDNEDGGPKCRGIELLRDPNFNKVGLQYNMMGNKMSMMWWKVARISLNCRTETEAETIWGRKQRLETVNIMEPLQSWQHAQTSCPGQIWLATGGQWYMLAAFIYLDWCTVSPMRGKKPLNYRSFEQIFYFSGKVLNWWPFLLFLF